MGLGLVDKPHLRRFKRKLDEQLNNLFVKKTDKATTNSLGIVKPDGTTITVDENGTISGSSSYELPTASTNTLGGVKIDGTSITIDNNGVISSSGGSGDGHTILDGSGTAMTQEPSLQFVNATSVSDDTNKTVVTVLPFTITVNANGGYDVTYPS